jgi:phosphomannomutase
MLRLGNAAGRVLERTNPHSSVVIGKDTRISGYMFEAALEAGWSPPVATSGCSARCRRPAVAYLTRSLRADAGIVISGVAQPARGQRHQVLLGAGREARRRGRGGDRGRARAAVHHGGLGPLGKATRIPTR